MSSARDIVDRQLEAYNAHDLDAFTALFAEDAVLIDLPTDAITASGIDAIRDIYRERFANPALKCSVYSKMHLGDFAIDREILTGLPTGTIELIAIYEVRDGLIRSVRFVRQQSSQRLRMTLQDEPGPFYHGTKADLKIGDEIGAGYASNFGKRNAAKYVYFSAMLEAATWGAELAAGEGRGRIYVVEPAGAFDDDPNVTDKKFPGNPTKSFRTKEPLRIVGEVTDWVGHNAEQVQAMRDGLEKIKATDVEAIEY